MIINFLPWALSQLVNKGQSWFDGHLIVAKVILACEKEDRYGDKFLANQRSSWIQNAHSIWHNQRHYKIYELLKLED